MARSYAGLAIMATRFGFRLAKVREGSQHLGMPVRYLLDDKNGVLLFRSLGDVERKLGAMALETSHAQSNGPARGPSGWFLAAPRHKAAPCRVRPSLVRNQFAA